MQAQPSLLSLEDFLTFSARLNYLLSARHTSSAAILDKILRGAVICGSPSTLEDGITYLMRAYSNRARRLGPLAVLHPLRTAHLLVLATEAPTTLDLLSAFLHDYYEDIYTPDLDQNVRQELEWHFSMLQQHLTEEESWQLEERLTMLTKKDDEQYHEYLGRLMDQARHTPEIIWVKLADRLDNTLDMRIIEDHTSSDFFRQLFDILFLRHEEKTHDEPPKAVEAPIDEAHRLFQMFKNAIFLTLVRRSGLDQISYPAQRLFEALTAASIAETGRILMQIFSYHVVDVRRQRELIYDVMRYSQEGGLTRITPSQRGHRLDGLFKKRFDHANRNKREAALQELQQDKELMVSSALAFLGVFESFRVSPQFRLGGIRATGLSEDDTLA
jgi:hypothetical protein